MADPGGAGGAALIYIYIYVYIYIYIYIYMYCTQDNTCNNALRPTTITDGFRCRLLVLRC